MAGHHKWATIKHKSDANKFLTYDELIRRELDQERCMNAKRTALLVSGGLAAIVLALIGGFELGRPSKLTQAYAGVGQFVIGTCQQTGPTRGGVIQVSNDDIILVMCQSTKADAPEAQNQ